MGSDDIEIQQCLDPILKDRERKFVNPDEENMVNVILFCSWLDPVPLLEFFRDSYLYFDFIKERLRLIPRIRFLTFLCLSRSTMIAEAYRKLNPDKFQLLGFESLREFVNERLGQNRFREFFDAFVLEIKNLLAEKGVEIVWQRKEWKLEEDVGQDASDEPSLKHDKEAKYSGLLQRVWIQV